MVVKAASPKNINGNLVKSVKTNVAKAKNDFDLKFQFKNELSFLTFTLPDYVF